jgi:pimeloyl-ACP methyl ester carboxylesterase
MVRDALSAATLLLTTTATGVAQARAVGARVPVRGMQMYYEVSGRGDPLIVLHGAYMTIPSMGAIIPRLAQTHKVYAIITGDADVVTLEHAVAMFRLLGGGVMGDMGKPLSSSRLAVMPATSHTAVITQPDVLYAFIEPFLKGQTPKGMFENTGAP